MMRRPPVYAPAYDSRWPPAPNGRYRVACYTGNYERTPVVFTQAASFDHRTLKAAVRRLASLISRQAVSGYRGARYDSLYIVTPEGKRLPLSAARKLIMESANG